MFLNQQSLDLDGTTLPKLPVMPSDVPGLNLYFLVSMEPMPGGKTLNCGLEIQANTLKCEDLTFISTQHDWKVFWVHKFIKH